MFFLIAFFTNTFEAFCYHTVIDNWASAFSPEQFGGAQISMKLLTFTQITFEWPQESLFLVVAEDLRHTIHCWHVNWKLFRFHLSEKSKPFSEFFETLKTIRLSAMSSGFAPIFRFRWAASSVVFMYRYSKFVIFTNLSLNRSWKIFSQEKNSMRRKWVLQSCFQWSFPSCSEPGAYTHVLAKFFWHSSEREKNAVGQWKFE